MIEYERLHPPSDEVVSHRHSIAFWIAVGVAEALLFLAVLPLLLFYLIYYQDGFDWNLHNRYTTMLNVHPLTMVVGFIIIYSQGVLVYRVLPFPKLIVKVTHGLIHGGVAVCIIIGLIAVIKFHNTYSLSSLYSLHSWIGLATVIGFGLQFAVGLTTFNSLVPAQYRTLVLPFHRFSGIAIFGLAVVACLTGLQKNVVYDMANDNSKHLCKEWNGSVCLTKWKYSEKSPEGTVVNCLGLAICLAVAVVVFVATRADWKQTKPTDAAGKVGEMISPVGRN